MSAHTHRTLAFTVAELRDELAGLDPAATVHLLDPESTDYVGVEGPAITAVHVAGGDVYLDAADVHRIKTGGRR